MSDARTTAWDSAVAAFDRVYSSHNGPKSEAIIAALEASLPFMPREETPGLSPKRRRHKRRAV